MAFNAENLMHLGLSAPLAMELMNLSFDVQVTTVSTANPTLAAGIATGQSLCVVVLTATGANTVTLRTAAQMFSDIPSNRTSLTYALTINNNGNANATLSAAAGDSANTTITGTAVVPAGGSSTYAVTFPTATTMTLTNITGGLANAASVTTVGTTQLFPFSSRIIAGNGNEYMYGFVPAASQSVVQYDFVTIDTLGNINSLMAANVKAGMQIGSAQTAIPASSYGWICVSGSGLLGNVQASVQNSLPVIPFTTGKIDTTAGVAIGVTRILGVTIPLTAGLTATAIGVGLTSPVVMI